MEQQTILFLGPQGCGKGTQLKLLAEHLQKVDPTRTILEPAMGNMLRELSERPNYTGRLLKPILAEGKLVEYAISVSVFGNYVFEHMEENQHLMIDGFPRTVEQTTLLDSLFRFYNRTNPTIVRIEISDEEALKRLLGRHRSDDTEESIRTRLAWSRKSEQEIKEWANKQGHRFVEINGEHPIEETQRLIREALNVA